MGETTLWGCWRFYSGSLMTVAGTGSRPTMVVDSLGGGGVWLAQRSEFIEIENVLEAAAIVVVDEGWAVVHED